VVLADLEVQEQKQNKDAAAIYAAQSLIVV
jgi:hypothetical protein